MRTKLIPLKFEFIWLCPDFVNGLNVFAGGGTQGADRKAKERPYKHWEHAEKILNINPNAFMRGDAILALRRAINIRNKAINDNYCLDAVNIRNWPNRIFARLELLKIVKPIMTKRLSAIRGEFEHNDRNPPPKAKCLEYLEFVWYYLRSTDMYFFNIATDVIATDSFDPELENAKMSAMIEIKPENNWNTYFEVEDMPAKYVSETPKKNWWKIRNGYRFEKRYQKDHVKCGNNRTYTFTGYKDECDIDLLRFYFNEYCISW